MTTSIFPISDLARATQVYSAPLGAASACYTPYYVGSTVGGQDIGLDPNGHRHGGPGPVCYWHVDDIQASLARLQEAGAQLLDPVKDVGGGKLIATLKDADDNVFGLTQEP